MKKQSLLSLVLVKKRAHAPWCNVETRDRIDQVSGGLPGDNFGQRATQAIFFGCLI